MWGHFTRELVLGDHLDAESIQATYVDGVLRLDIALAESAKPRRIQVAAAKRTEDPKEITS
ncbi:18 kDa heat shock protein [compost metagenome]